MNRKQKGHKRSRFKDKYDEDYVSHPTPPQYDEDVVEDEENTQEEDEEQGNNMTWKNRKKKTTVDDRDYFDKVIHIGGIPDAQLEAIQEFYEDAAAEAEKNGETLEEEFNPLKFVGKLALYDFSNIMLMQVAYDPSMTEKEMAESIKHITAYSRMYIRMRDNL